MTSSSSCPSLFLPFFVPPMVYSFVAFFLLVPGFRTLSFSDWFEQITMSSVCRRDASLNLMMLTTWLTSDWSWRHQRFYPLNCSVSIYVDVYLMIYDNLLPLTSHIDSDHWFACCSLFRRLLQRYFPSLSSLHPLHPLLLLSLLLILPLVFFSLLLLFLYLLTFW